MLINTVILFLRDALPIFVITTLLVSLTEQQRYHHNWCYKATVLGTLLSIVLLIFIDNISQAFDATGKEWLYIILYISCYFLMLVILAQPLWQHYFQIVLVKYAATVFLALIIMLNVGDFLIYITSFWHQSNAPNVVIIGITLGIGICLSIAVLLYFTMMFIRPYFRYITEFLLILFSVGLIMQATNLMSQIDIISLGHFVWDSNFLIEESAEVGYLLMVFFGYDATPASIQLLLYFITLSVAVSVLIISARLANKPKSKLKPTPILKPKPIKDNSAQRSTV